MTQKISKFYHQNGKIINYIIIGILTVCISFLAHYIFSKPILDLNKKIQLYLVDVMTWIIIVLFVYFTNRKFVFKRDESNKLKEFCKFVLAWFLLLIVYWSLNFILISVWSIDDKISKLIALIVVLILNYIISKFFVFNFDKIAQKKVLFISSTGGHLSELLQLSPLFDKYNSYLITEKTKSTKALKLKFKHVNYLVYGTKDHLFKYIFKFLFNVLKSIYLFIKIRPNVIVTTGTHTAVPMCYIGKMCFRKIIFIETFANRNSKTLSGKLVYPIADKFIVQWEDMLELYPKAIYGGWIY